MKAAVLHQYNETLTGDSFVSYEDVPDPKIENPTDVIVRIGGAGVCRTDLHVVEGIWRSKVDIQLPYIMGHENAGWIEAVGSAVTGLKMGDPVICHPLVTSGHCPTVSKELSRSMGRSDLGESAGKRVGESAKVQAPTAW